MLDVMTTVDAFEPLPTLKMTSLEILKVYFDPLRQRIVNQVYSEARSIQQIAQALDIPFTRLYYHINLLEKHNIIQLVEVRQGAGAIEEKYYRVKAHMFVVDRTLMMPTDDGSMPPAMETVIETVLHETEVELRRSVQQHIVDLSVTAPHEKALVMRRGAVRLTHEQARQFQEDMLELIRRYQAMNIDEGVPADDYNVSIALFPVDLTSEE
jgi:hypothetical protein